LICFLTVPFRTIYIRIGDPLLIVTALSISSSLPNRGFFYITSFISLLSSPNLYFIIGSLNNGTISYSTAAYFEQLLLFIEAGSLENTYRGDVVSK
jgi:hypothetical protein